MPFCVHAARWARSGRAGKSPGPQDIDCRVHIAIRHQAATAAPVGLARLRIIADAASMALP